MTEHNALPSTEPRPLARSSVSFTARSASSRGRVRGGTRPALRVLVAASAVALASSLLGGCDKTAKEGEACAQHTDCGSGLVCSPEKVCRPSISTSSPASSGAGSTSTASSDAAASLPKTVPLCNATEPCKSGDFEGCTKTCEGGDAAACRELWRWYGFDQMTAREHDEAKTKQYQAKQVALDEAGCGKGDACACGRLFDNFAKGHGVERDKDKAVEKGARGCELGDPVTCGALGDVYTNGIPVDVGKDRAKAREFYERAFALREKGCNDGSLAQCAYLGGLYAGGTGVTQSAEKALTLGRKACDGGEAIGCSLVGDWYRDGRPGITRDLRQAHDMYERGCKLERQDACREVKAVESMTP